jgi:methyltransferase (TIGR00027 family)
MTARWIAAQRASLASERPTVQAGNADAERRLYEGFSWAFVLRGLRQTGMAARTRFFDDAIVAAITRGVDQIVIVGAGYDGRALRFGGGGVSWIEVDHPATQADKRRRLASLGVSLDHLKLVAVDLITDDLDVALSDAGYAVGRPTLFICEGLFAYLPPETGRALCRSLRRRSHPDSVLAANFRVAPVSGGSPRLLPTAVDGLLSIMGEHRRMDFCPGDAETLFEESGWMIVQRDTLDHNRLDGRSHLVVIAATPRQTSPAGCPQVPRSTCP